MGTTPDNGEIILDGWRFKVANDVGEENISTFPGKVTFGDFGADSNDLLSVWTVDNLTGGHGVADLQEGTDQNRYRISDGIYTRYPRQFTKSFAFTSDDIVEGSFNDYRPGIDMYDPAGGVWHWYSSVHHRFLVDDVHDAAMTVKPEGPQWAAFQGDSAVEPYLFIPQGLGYSTYVRSTTAFTYNAVDATHPGARAFITFDDRQLYCIDRAGQLWMTTDPTILFSNLGPAAKLDGSVIPRGLLNYFNQAGENTIYIVGTIGVWAYDPGGPRLWKTRIQMPVHPHAGKASCEWRGNLYFAAGMDLIEWNGSVQRNIGLSRDDGIPFDYQGYIIALQSSLNSIYALVQGRTDAGGVFWSVHEWSGLGWHQLFATQDKAPLWMGLSQVSSSTAYLYLYAGQDDDNAGGRWRQSIPVAFTNPREAIDAGGFDFGFLGGVGLLTSGTTYSLESGRFDAGMLGYAKTANAVEMDVRHLPSGEQIHLDYRVDQETAYTQLDDDDPLSDTYNPIIEGHNILPFGTPDADGITPGILFRTIELRLRYVDDDTPTGNTSVVENMVLSFVKQRRGSYSYTCTLDLQEPYQGKSVQEMRDKLDAIIDAGLFVPLKHRFETRRVRVAQVGGSGATGKDERTQRRISILEIPISLSPDADA